MSQQPTEQKPSTIYLFISQHCENSRKLIEEIRKKPEVSKNIQAIPVENAPRLPPNLERVPSILVDGKMLVGGECFDWVKKQGELDPGPVLGAKGFETSGYSFIGAEDNEGVGNSFSFLGQKNGSEGVDSQQANVESTQQSNTVNSARNDTTINYEQLTQQRDKEFNSQKQQQRAF